MKRKFYTLSVFLLLNILLLGCNYIEIDLTTTITTPTVVDTSPVNSETPGVEPGDTNEDNDSTESGLETIYTITEVKNGTIGDVYTTRATVVGITQKGALLYDGNDFIFVYLETVPSVSKNDYVEVTGATSEYGGAVQYSVGTSISKISVATEYDFDATEFSGEQLTSYVNNINVGDYFKITGTLSVNGSFLNLVITGSQIMGSLNTNSNLELNSMSGKTITVEGFVLYLSGPKYLNLLVTEVNVVVEVNEEPGLPVITNTMDLTILTVNDLHGYIEQEVDGTSGISNMAYLIMKLEMQIL